MPIADLISASGSTPSLAAEACGVDARLFVRIDQGRQPISRPVAAALAGHLGVAIATVVRASPGGFVDSSDPTHRRPVPMRIGIDPEEGSIELAAPAVA